MDAAEVIIVGGGIAGLSAAHALARAGVGRVRLLEREAAWCTHSSGRNAAIFRHLATAAGDLELALRSRVLLDELLGGEPAWLRRTGAWYVAKAATTLDPLAALADQARLPCRRASGAELQGAIPSIRGGAIDSGLWVEGDGVIDIHAVAQALLRSFLAAGGGVSLGAEVAAIERAGHRVAGVRLASGERVAAGAVVVAGGAWSAALGASSGAPLPLEPRRRHLVLLEASPPLPPESPVVWSLGDELYYRPESGGVLASPCDEEAWPAELPAPAATGLELLAAKLGRLAPPLSDASVRRSWACLRTFAPDGAAAVGPDPRVPGLFWLAGLGGHGMTGGVAAGELLAATVTGRAHPLAATLAPGRLRR